MGKKKTRRITHGLSARGLIFKNNIIDAWHAKAQLFGLIVLVFLSTVIFTITSITNTRIGGSYEELIASSNMHDFVGDFSDVVFSQNKVTGEPQNDDAIIQNDLDDASDKGDAFTYDRVETRTFALENNAKIIKTVGYDDRQKIDKLVVYEGVGLRTNDIHGVVINAEFCAKNNLQINDIIRLQPDEYGSHILVGRDVNLSFYQGKNIDEWIDNSIYSTKEWFQIRGFGVSADMMAPIIDQTTPLPDKARSGIAYVSASNFGLSRDKKTNHWIYDKTAEKLTVSSQSDQEIYYVGKFEQQTNLAKQVAAVDEFLQNYAAWNISKKDGQDSQLVFAKNDLKYRFAGRVNLISATINAYHTFAWLLMAIVLVITIFVLILVIKKRIEHTRTQLGVLKALGYYKKTLITSFFAYPLLIALIGGTLGWLVGLGVQQPIINIFTNYFNIIYGNFYFDWLSWTFSILLIFIVLSLFTMLLTYMILKQNTIHLIHNQGQIKLVSYVVFIKGIFAHCQFPVRLRASLFASSTGKMTAVTMTMLLGTVMLTAAVIGPKIMQDNLRANYTGLNYKSIIEYESPVWNLPYTFYRTYDPLQKAWQATTDNNDNHYFAPSIVDVVKEIEDHKINSSFYNPDINFLSDKLYMPMSFLNWKNISSSFLNNQSRYGKNDHAAMGELIAKLSWPKYGDLVDDTTVAKALVGDGANLDLFTQEQRSEMYRLFRSFYLEFRSSIGMSVDRVYLNKSSESIDNYQPNIDAGKLDFKSPALLRINSGDKTANAFDIYHHHLPEFYDKFILQNSDIGVGDDEILGDLVNWFIITYYNRIADAIVQGTYSRSPYFVKQNMAQAFNQSKDFNIAFNVEPYRFNDDYLGTYLNIDSENLKFKMYGLDANQSMVSLTDSDGNNLNQKLFSTLPNNVYPIVVNQTLAQKLLLHPGTEIKWNVASQKVVGQVNNHEWNDQEQWDFSSLVGQTNGYGPFGLDGSAVKHGGGDLYSAFLPSNPTSIELAAASQKVRLSVDQDSVNFEVVGVHNGYGDPRAYLSQDTANRLAHYDRSQNDLYQYFRQEWINFNLNNPSENKVDMTGVMQNHQVWNFLQAMGNSGDYDGYQKLMQRVKAGDAEALFIKHMFDSEFPIFNYKLSNSSTIDDLMSGFSTSQRYGDMSLIGLDGSHGTGAGYPAYSMGSAIRILPVDVSRAILQEITQLVDAILLTFAVIALIIAFTIIMLSTNLIIRENRTIISCMKAIGYNNFQINHIILGMYIPLVAISYVIGVFIAWIAIKAVLVNLAMNTIWVLPFIFSWWIPLVSLAIIILIYLCTLLISWFDLRKVGLVYALKTAE